MLKRKPKVPKIPSTLGAVLPYLGMKDDGLLWLKDGSGGVTLRLVPKNCLSFTESDFEALRAGLTPLVDQIPQGAMLQIWLSRRRSSALTDPAYRNWIALREVTDTAAPPVAVTPAQQQLKAAREKYLAENWRNGSVFQTDIFLSLRVPIEQRPAPQSTMGPIAHLKKRVFAKNIHRKTSDMMESDLSALKLQLRTQLETLNITTEEVSAQEKWSLLYQFFNPERKSVPKFEEAGQVLNLSDCLAKTDLLETKQGLQLGRTRLRIGSLKTYPESSQPAMLASLVNSSDEFDLIYTVLALDGVKERDRLSRKQRLATGMASGGHVRDITAEGQLRDIEETLQAMGAGEKLCAASLHLICREDPDGDGERSHSFDQLLSQAEGLGMGCQWFEETVGAFPVFFGTLPLAPTHLTRPKRILSSNLSDMLPIYGIGAGHREATVLFETPYQSNLGFSLYEKSPSANAILAGSIGSGKSTLACGLILGMNAGGPKEAPSSFVIDVGNSFKRTITYLGGSSLDLSPEQGTCINPFDLEPGQTRPMPEKTKFLTALFDEILGDAGNLSKLERALLETEILLFYEKEEVRTLSTFKTHLEKSDSIELRRFAKLLSLWCKPAAKFAMKPAAHLMNKMKGTLEFTACGHPAVSYQDQVSRIAAGLYLPVQNITEDRPGAQVLQAHIVRTRIPNRVDFSEIDLARVGQGQFYYGKTNQGKFKDDNLKDAIHLLVAGQIGTGKTYFIQQLAITILMRSREAHAAIIDMKGGVDFPEFRSLQNCELVTTHKDAHALLDALVKIHKDRAKYLADKGKRNWRDLSLKELKGEERFENVPIGPILLITDELAELTGYSKGSETKQSIHQRLSLLGRLARATGIHIIAGTQRPDRNIIDGQTKDSLVTKVCLAVPSVAASTLVVGNMSAYAIGRHPGRAIVATGLDRVTVQTPFLSPSELKKLTDQLYERLKQDGYSRKVVGLIPSDTQSQNVEEVADES